MNNTIPPFIIAIVSIVISALLIGAFAFVHKKQEETYVSIEYQDEVLDGKNHHPYREGNPYGTNDEDHYQAKPYLAE